MVNLTVAPEEANYILQLLGNQPTSSGAWPLMMRLQAQVQGQVAPPAPKPEPAPSGE